MRNQTSQQINKVNGPCIAYSIERDGIDIFPFSANLAFVLVDPAFYTFDQVPKEEIELVARQWKPLTGKVPLQIVDWDDTLLLYWPEFSGDYQFKRLIILVNRVARKHRRRGNKVVMDAETYQNEYPEQFKTALDRLDLEYCR